MTPTLPPLLRGWRAALLLAAVAFLSPGRASASCGDYITILPNGQQAGPAPHAMPGAAADQPAPAKPPCHGPNCSNAPSRETPPAPPAPVTSPVKEQARCIASGDELNAGGESRFARDTTSLRPIRRASSVFHPPRAG